MLPMDLKGFRCLIKHITQSLCTLGRVAFLFYVICPSRLIRQAMAVIAPRPSSSLALIFLHEAQGDA